MISRLLTCMLALALLPSCMISSHSKTSRVEERSGLAAEYQSDVITHLFFVLDDGRRRFSDADFRAFADREIVSRFPDGFNVMAGEGQWRPRDENAARVRESRVVTIVHRKSASTDEMIGEIIDRFREVFNEERVLRVDSPAQVRFR